MTVHIDGDSCPRAVRDLVARAASRENIPVVSYANRPIPYDVRYPVRQVLVETREGAADAEVVKAAVPGDLVLTRDIPLAADLVQRGVCVVNDRGTVYTAENVRERLSLRNFMADLRSSGLQPETTASYSKKEWNEFVKTFDREFMRLVRAKH